jgi:hypothetical protein
MADRGPMLWINATLVRQIADKGLPGECNGHGNVASGSTAYMTKHVSKKCRYGLAHKWDEMKPMGS